MSKSELFSKAAEAIDKYTRALEMNLPEAEIERYCNNMNCLLDEVNRQGLQDEFGQIVTVI